MKDAPRVFARPKKRLPAEGQSDRFTLMIVEDNDVNVKVLKALLSCFDCELLVAMDGRKAVSLFKQNRIDLILMDIEMPLMNGFDATKEIRAFEAENGLNKTPIIAVTAHIKPADQHLCVAADMNDYLHKPVKMEELKKRVRIWQPALPFAAAPTSAAG
ncbi:MAG: response regulator [Pseudomonadota bacterium]